MRRLGFLILLIAIALTFYNTWQISQLREELDTLRQKPGVVAEKSATSSGDGVQDLLARAQAHGSRANQLLKKGDVKNARLEMQKSLEALRKAEAAASAQTSSLRENFDAAQKKLEKLIGQFSNEPRGQRPGN